MEWAEWVRGNFEARENGRGGHCGHMAVDIRSRTTGTKRPVRSKRGGGPKSPEGKASSSGNSTKHGMLSKRHTILADETREEYEETRLGWLENYEPADYHEARLVDQLILNDWLLKRANKRLLQAEAALVGEEDTCHPATWTAEQEHKIELVLRYKTTQERAFYRSLSAVEGLRKDILREKILNRRLLDQQNKEIEGLKKQLAERPPKPAEAPVAEAKKLFCGQKSPKKQKKTPVIDQWVEIEVSPAGKTVTTLYPSNEILIQDGQKKWPPPELVYRRMHFVNGVPDEYAWATSDERIRAAGGMGIQRMTVETWADLIEKEKALGTGHLLPCGGNLPRPEDRGGCDCPVCSRNRKILEARKAA